ncbi:MAG: hypothetical protein ACM3NH_03025 [Candidatus Saccharibacteria bacterium]
MSEDPILDPGIRDELQSAMPQPKKSYLNKFAIIAAVSAFVLIGVASWFLFARPKDAPKPVSDRVAVAIKGPDKLSSGNQTTYKITYNNGENADMTNVSMEVFYPQNFKFRRSEPAASNTGGSRFGLPVLKSGETGQVLIDGALSGSTGEDKEIRVTLHYMLSNFNSEFQVSQNFHTTVTAPDMLLEITGPIEVTNGQDTTYTVSYNNVSGQDFDNMGLELNYPDGFVFTSGNPPAAKNNSFWSLGKLAAGASGKVEITGSFTGDNGQEKMVTGNLGAIINNNFAPQVTASASFRIAPSALSVTLSAEPKDVIHLGQLINYTLDYRNNGFIGMTNVVIAVNLQGTALDLKQLRANNAIITGSTLTWKSATLKELALVSPNKAGKIMFSVPVKQNLTTNIKEQAITGSVSIYSDQVTKPVRGLDVPLKLASNLDLIVSGEYVSGALPMQVGQPTLFSLTFMLVNYSNDLTDVQVDASMPLPASAWKSVIVPDSEKDNVIFDPNGNKIRWKAGNLPAFTGKYTPARTVTFQIEAVPEVSDQSRIMTLISDVFASGQDSFVNQAVESKKTAEVKVSDLNDDQVDAKGAAVR